MKRLIVTLTVFTGLLLFIGCEKKEDKPAEDKCGAYTLWSADADSLIIIKSTFNAADSSRTLTFQGPTYPCDICTGDDAIATWWVNDHNADNMDIEWTGRVDWGTETETVAIGHTVNTKYNLSKPDTFSKASLQEVFGDNAASLNMFFIAKFKTFGNDSLDRVKFWDQITSMDMQINYYKYKD